MIVKEEVKHFNWWDFKVELCYIVEVLDWKSLHCLAPYFTDYFCMVPTTALFILYFSPYHFSLWIKSRSWEEMLAVWTTSETELFSSWCFFMNTVSICVLLRYFSKPFLLSELHKLRWSWFHCIITNGRYKWVYKNIVLFPKAFFHRRERSVLYCDVAV